MQDPSQRQDFWDPLKFIPLGRENRYLTMAGEIRPFYEIYHNYNWGAGPQSPNGYYLQRVMGSTDFHLGDGPGSSWNCEAATCMDGREARDPPRTETRSM